jgi:predicted nuclease of predicted toxin-antitoxin system
MKFIVDMPIAPQVAEWLVRGGHAAVHVSQVGMGSVDDATIIRRALTHGEIIVNADLDYPRLIVMMRSGGPGLILFRGGDWNGQQIIQRLERVFNDIESRDLERSIVVVDRQRIRKRTLPVVPNE